MKRFILRERKSTERARENVFVLLELEVKSGVVSICGTDGYSLTRRDARVEEKDPERGEVLFRSKRVYFVEGIGQITSAILDFFPEMKPYMGRHMLPANAADWLWLTRTFTKSKEIAIEALEKGWAC